MRPYTGIGSRETPELILMLMELIAELLCATGFRGRSGAAPGADSAFRRGARRSDRYGDVGFEDFLPDHTMFDKEEFGWVKPDQEERIFDARMFDAYEESVQLALSARGSWNGLGRGGILLHSRNPMQVLGGSLKQPSKFCIFYAKPKGKQGLVEGGTNTAVQVALRHNVPVFNLYLEDVQQRMIRWLYNNIEKLCEESQKRLKENFSLGEKEDGQAKEQDQQTAVSDLPQPEGDHDRDGEDRSGDHLPHDEGTERDLAAGADGPGRQLDDHAAGRFVVPAEAPEGDSQEEDHLP